jgi:hypothetical protein
VPRELRKLQSRAVVRPTILNSAVLGVERKAVEEILATSCEVSPPVSQLAPVAMRHHHG